MIYLFDFFLDVTVTIATMLCGGKNKQLHRLQQPQQLILAAEQGISVLFRCITK